MLYILYGHDDFSLKEGLERIKDGLGDRESLSSNITVFEGKQVGFNQLMDACMAVPFLGTHRLVIVEGLLSKFEKGMRVAKGSSNGDEDGEGSVAPKKGDKKEWAGLGRRVREMPPTTVLVLVDGDIKKDNSLLKDLSAAAEVRQFPVLRGKALSDWIRNRVKSGGGDIEPDALRMLASLVGDNLWILSGEIEKLILYTGGKRIEEKDVREVVSYAREANVFSMVDAIIEGHAATATPLMQQLLDEGAASPYLLFMITRQIRMLVQIKELSQQRCSRNDIRQRLGIASDFVLNKGLDQSRNYSMERLEQVYRKLLETDISIKRGIYKGEMALDLLVAELCV